MDFATLMTREPAIPFLGPLTPQRGSFSRSSTSSTVTTISNLSTPSFFSQLSATSTAVGDVEEKGTEQCEDCGWSIRPTTGKGETALLLPVPGKDFALKPLVAALRARLQSQLADSSRAPRIVGLLATSDTGCKQYASATAKACKTNGVHFDVENVTETVGEERASFDQVKTAIEVLNADMTVDGLIVYFPIFNPEQDDLLRRAISPRIDVEGVHPQSLVISSYFPPGTANDSTEDEVVHPCTALAVVRILQSLESIYQSDAVKGQRLVGKTITIVNRSETVGRPLAAMLANEGAMVYSIDITGIQVYRRHNTSRRFCINPAQDHITPYDCFGTSDVIISAVPSDKYKVPTSSIRYGAVCVNVATGNNFEDDVNEAAGMFVRRVGGVTTLMLQMNAMTLFRRHNEVA